MVGIIDSTVSRGTDGREILIAETDDRFPLIHGRRLDNGHRIGKYIVAVAAVRPHQRCSGHNPLEVIHRINYENYVANSARLAVRQKCQQVSDCRGRQVAHGNGRLFRIYAAGDGHVIADLPVHTDRFAVAVARYEAGFQSVGVGFVQHLAHKAVQPLGAEFQHCLADRHKRGQLEQRRVDFLKTRRQFFHDLCAELSPRGLLIPVGIHHHTNRAARIDELNMRQQRVCGLELVKDCVEYGFRHHDVKAVERLLGVFGFHCFG